MQVQNFLKLLSTLMAMKLVQQKCFRVCSATKAPFGVSLLVIRPSVDEFCGAFVSPSNFLFLFLTESKQGVQQLGHGRRSHDHDEIYGYQAQPLHVHGPH